MRAFRFGLRIAVASFLLVGAMGAARPVRAQSDPELDALNRQVQQLHQAGKYQAAIAVAERYVEVAKRKRGEDDPGLCDCDRLASPFAADHQPAGSS